jgi:hypothetical protein
MNDTPELGEQAAPVAFSEPQTALPMPPPVRSAFRPRRPGPSRAGQPKTDRRKSRRPKAPALRRPFRRPRLADQIGFWRRLRSVLELVFVSVILGFLLAAIVASVVAGIVLAIQNALNA